MPTNHDPNRRAVLGAAAALATGVPLATRAQAWPAKQVRLVVPYAPGGGNDLLARVLGEKLAPALGQPVVVENRAGAGAIVGTEYVARATPDGHTLLVAASGPIVFNPVLVSKLPYSPLQDLAPVSMIGSFPLILAVHEAFPARTLAELVAWSKNDANKPSYSYPAASFQLVMELLKSRTGLKALNVPYQGSAPSINAVMTQEVPMTLIDSGPIAALLKAGRLRALAVTSEQRLPAYPTVPTLREQGVDLVVNFWTGLLAPAGTPAAIVRRLQEETARAMALPDVVDRLQRVDIKPVTNSPAEFARTIAQEIELWTQVARDNNIRAS
jgi:tripartite-type tricarboxylate transporter receptor subunit TctC